MRVLIAAGGTAGHINPALAIAGLKKADPTAEIHFAGRKEGMEYRLVGQAGYPFHHIEITRFPAQAVAEQHQAQHRYPVESGPLRPQGQGHDEGGQSPIS